MNCCDFLFSTASALLCRSTLSTLQSNQLSSIHHVYNNNTHACDFFIFPLYWRTVTKEDILVVTYRNHHNTFKADDPNVTIVNKTFKNMNPLVRLLQFTYSMIMVHYFLWIFPMFGSLYFFYVIGAWPISVLLLAIYIPTFINGDQYKKGRPWNGFRMSSLWDLTLNYCGVEVVRTQPLDPTKKYIFGLYPHGILILSRLAMYGGIWERLFPGIETRVLGASPMFWSPGSREICLWMGAVDAAKKVAVNCLKKYNLNLMVYPVRTRNNSIYATERRVHSYASSVCLMDAS